jgi:hypothetical protein
MLTILENKPTIIRQQNVRRGVVKGLLAQKLTVAGRADAINGVGFNPGPCGGLFNIFQDTKDQCLMH